MTFATIAPSLAAWFRPLAAGRTGEDRPGDLRHRLRLLAGCLLLGAIAFHTAPGNVISETKVDMAVNPLGFLGRAAHLWDDAYFGHLQNQAYGYLFPMGPFYAVLRGLDMPPWTIQRLWMTLVLCAAFLGVERLARALRIGSPNCRILAGLGYALAPHALALIGVNSSEFQPSAVLPWVLLPLVYGTREAISPRRAAALSAVAFLFAGGINAAAELAVLVVPGLYLLTRSRGRRTWALLAWWLACVAAVSMWWLVPLLLLGRYIFSFLPFIETADATTSVTSLFNALRGTSGWLSFLPVDGRAWLPAAYEQATRPWLIAVTAAVAALGVAGLVRRGTPERTFLTVSALVGVVIVTAGHADALAFPWAEQVRAAFDGPLAPFRNLHKFDALIRLPLALGLAALPMARPSGVRLRVAALSAGVAVLSAVPVATAGVTPPGSFADLPSYWRDAANWLNRETGQGMVLAIPGSKRGEYQWGRPLDEPMQMLLTVRWANHSNVPWGSAGLARLLQTIDERFGNGIGSEGLTLTLRRIGVKYLLVRNDLARDTIGTAWPARVHQALDDSTGLRRVAEFGPLVGDASSGIASGWFDQPYRALEVYEVPDPAPLASVVPADPTVRATGAPEGVLAMAENGLLDGDAPVLLGDEPGASAIPDADTVVTDTLRRRHLVFGDVRRSTSGTLTDEESEREKVTDLLDPAWAGFAATARHLGVAGIAASSSDAGVTASAARRDPGRQPYAAFDGDPRTSWRSDGWNGALGEWLEVRFTAPLRVPRIMVAFEQGVIGPPVAEVAVETDAGTRRAAVRPTADPQPVELPDGPTRRLRIRVTKLAHEPGNAFGDRVGITEVTIPGVRPGRTIDVPGPSGSSPGAVVLTEQGSAPACMRGSAAWTCSQTLEILGEDGYGFDRMFEAARDETRTVTGRAVLTDPGFAAELTTLPKVYPQVTASSTATDHPAVLGRAAMDGDPRTIWYALPHDRRPALDVDLGRKQRISGIRVLFPDSHLGNPPVKVTVRTDTHAVQAWVGGDGWITFPETRARKLRIEFAAAASRAVEVAEITIPGVDPVRSLTGFPVRLPCGFGPTLVVDGHAVQTRITGGRLDDVLNGRPLAYAACGPVRLAAGPARVTVAPTDPFRVKSVVLRRDDATTTAASARAVPASVESWAPEERRLHVSATARSYLVVNENFNVGWEARLGGTRLTPVRLDGWRQAWMLPAGASGTVVLRYAPDPSYRTALLGGFGLALAVVVLVLVPSRLRRGLRRVHAAWVRARWVWPAAPLLGLWIGGAAGAAITTGAAVVFLWLRRVATAQHAPDDSRLHRAARALLSEWTPAVLLGLAGLAAAIGAAVGAADGAVADLAADLAADAVPQVLCLLVVARLVVAVAADRPSPSAPRVADRAESAGSGVSSDALAEAAR
ncbi:alpha-(1-_3)-arabinofuranosyltransferase [Thermopolyspora sp. NPDC052614]|uniref:alpha-(1->3)-arabinofuranosyltransferase n=1 Tax=Thermopolyspora sp. NPDC052614 TaxID=3155682 RepID=UPI00343261D2